MLLSITQVVSWGSIYYAFPVLIVPIQAEMGWSRHVIVGAFSLSLLVAGLMAVPAGYLIREYGGRRVMTAGSLLGAAALAGFSLATTVIGLYAIGAAIGIAMALVLYEPAFATLIASRDADYRRAITLLTLVGGFASTVFWPLTQWLVSASDWRMALMLLAGMNLLVNVPLSYHLPETRGDLGRGRKATEATSIIAIRTQQTWHTLGQALYWRLVVVFSTNALVLSGVSVHLLAMLHERHVDPQTAAWLGALLGPMQVLARLGEFTFGRRYATATIALAGLAVLVVAMMLFGSGNTYLSIVIFVCLYGASNGVMTIVRGVLPAEWFGKECYAVVNGLLSAPTTLAKALGPLAASLIWSVFGGYNVLVWCAAVVAMLSLLVFAHTVWTVKRKSCLAIGRQASR